MNMIELFTSSLSQAQKKVNQVVGTLSARQKEILRYQALPFKFESKALVGPALENRVFPAVDPGQIA